MKVDFDNLSSIATVVFGAVSSILAIIAKKQSNKAHRNKTMLNTIISGIEHATLDGHDTSFVKRRIEEVARANGVSNPLDSSTKNLK